MPNTSDKLHGLRQEFDDFTKQCVASKLPDVFQPSALLLGYDPLLKQGTFRMTGDSIAIAQAMLHALRDRQNEGLRAALAIVVDSLLNEK